MCSFTVDIAQSNVILVPSFIIYYVTTQSFALDIKTTQLRIPNITNDIIKLTNKIIIKNLQGFYHLQ